MSYRCSPSGIGRPTWRENANHVLHVTFLCLLQTPPQIHHICTSKSYSPSHFDLLSIVSLGTKYNLGHGFLLLNREICIGCIVLSCASCSVVEDHRPMFWRVQEQENEEDAGLPLGQVRVLVVGDSGVGKTSIVHLIVKGSAIARPSQTVGCAVSIKHTTYGNAGRSSSSLKGDAERGFFVELWDVSGHDRYKHCRSIFYSQINGVIFVHDLSQRKTKISLQKWAAEIAEMGTFSAPLGAAGPGGLPIPYLVIGNKVDITSKFSGRVSNGNLVDVARQWVEKQGLLPSSDQDLPLTGPFPSSSQLIAAAKEARFDKEAAINFFRLLIRRRYFPDEFPSPSRWSLTSSRQPIYQSGDNLLDADQYNKMSINTDAYKGIARSPVASLQDITLPRPQWHRPLPPAAPVNHPSNLPSFITIPTMADSQWGAGT